MFKISSNIPSLLQQEEESGQITDECSDSTQKGKLEIETVVETESSDDDDNKGLGTKKAEAATLIWSERHFIILMLGFGFAFSC